MANIADKIAQIRQAILGKDVRESIASGIEAINTEVETTVAAEATRQSNEVIRVENESGRVSGHSERMDEVDAIAAAYDAATKANLSVEVSNARTSTVKSKTFATLDARLEESEQDAKTHLADNAAHGNSIDTPGHTADGTNADTYNWKTGFYIVGPNMANLPAAHYWVITAWAYGSGVMLIACSASNPNLFYTRVKVNDTWTPWIERLNRDNLTVATIKSVSSPMDQFDIQIAADMDVVMFRSIGYAIRFDKSSGDIYSAGNKHWHVGNAGPFYKGAGSPEGIITAPVGAIYQRTDGGTSTTLYIKETGTGNTGWKAK